MQSWPIHHSHFTLQLHPQNSIHPIGHLLIPCPAEVHFTDSLSSLLRLIALFGLFLDDGGLGVFLDPGVFEEHGVGWTGFGDLVETAFYEVLCCIGVALFREAGGFAFDDSLGFVSINIRRKNNDGLR